MTTAQMVFDTAMGLIDEVNETTGSTDNADTREQKQRTLLILNVLRGEFPAQSGASAMPTVITAFDTAIDLDDYVCQTILPYGLAAHLLLDENPSSAGFFQQRYEELKRSTGAMRPDGSEDITDLYGCLSAYDIYGEWN